MASAGVAAGLTGLLASSCCALPIALAGLGMTSVAGTLIPTLAALRLPMLVLAACFVLIGWLSMMRQRRVCASLQACTTTSGPPRAAQMALVLVTGIVVLASIWPTWVEPHAIRWVR